MEPLLTAHFSEKKFIFTPEFPFKLNLIRKMEQEFTSSPMKCPQGFLDKICSFVPVFMLGSKCWPLTSCKTINCSSTTTSLLPQETATVFLSEGKAVVLIAFGQTNKCSSLEKSWTCIKTEILLKFVFFKLTKD